MSTQRYEIEALLGDIEATDEQIDTLMRLSDAAEALDPEDHLDIFDACLRWVLDADHDQQVSIARDLLMQARLDQAHALDTIRGIIIAADDDGMARKQIADRLGVDRMTVYATLGLR